jgi:hypothetical protein
MPILVFFRKHMNYMETKWTMARTVDISASFSGVRGDAPRQLVTKPVTQGMRAPGSADYFPSAFRGPMNFS